MGFIVLGGVGLFIWLLLRPKKVNWGKYQLSAEFKEILTSMVPLSSYLPENLIPSFHQKVSYFLDTTDIQGFDGVDITDEIRLSIAGNASILLLGRPGKSYSKLHSVHVFPDSFFQESQSQAGTSITHVSGISFEGGKVVLAWSHTQSGSQNMFDGQNVAIHEFAHQFDQADGSADGVPYDLSPQLTQVWAGAMSAGFKKLTSRSNKRSRSLINQYGGTHPAEFFAVLSETYFEKGKHLKRKEPDLYATMEAYYGLDTASWVKS